MLGTISILFCGIFYLKYRKRVLLVSGGFNLALLCILLNMVFYYFNRLTGTVLDTDGIVFIPINLVNVAAFTSCLPLLVFTILSLLHFLAVIFVLRLTDLFPDGLVLNFVHITYFILLFAGVIVVGAGYFLNPPCMEKGKPTEFFF